MSTLNYSKEINIKYECDVCVIGAGPAGIAASIAAARNGCNTMLFDSHTMAGGMGTAGLLPVFMPFTDGINFLAGGIGREIHDRGIKYGAIGCDGGIAINTEPLKRLYDKMLLESKVTISYQTLLIDVVIFNSNMEAAVFSAKSGVFGVKAKVFIDCTGDGDLAFMAGAPYEKGDENHDMMPATLCSSWAGVDWEKYQASKTYSHNDENMLAALKNANDAGDLNDSDYHHTGMVLRSRQTVGGNLTHCFGVDPADEASLTRGLIEGRSLLERYEKFYRKYIPGFENAELIASGSLLGIRESRRITGRYTLCIDDYRQRANFDDEIGRYNFSIDIHPSKNGEDELKKHKQRFAGEQYAPGESYGIPYRILCPVNVDNLLTAGRCISADRFVMASIRVMPACFITGMAAGTAAAISVNDIEKPCNIDIVKLQKNLQNNGAFLPNF